jgi:hypothetical protein
MIERLLEDVPELQPRLRNELEAAASEESRGAPLASDELNATPLSWITAPWERRPGKSR